MATSSPYTQLLAVLRLFLRRSAGTLAESYRKVLQLLRSIWFFLRSGYRQLWAKRGDTSGKKGQGQLGNTRTRSGANEVNPDERHTRTSTTTPYDRDDSIIPLDKNISCSLQPYGPYISRNLSRSSINLGIHTARSAHSVAIQSSRNASRSSQNINPSDNGSIQEEYTFAVNSPDQPHPRSPLPLPRRGYSNSSPQLGSGGGGHDILEHDILERARTTTSSPPESEIALPAGISVGVDGEHGDYNLAHQRIFPLAPEWFQRYERPKFAEKKQTNVTITALTLNFASEPNPPGWEPCIHPEGVLYWYNREKKVVTEANLHDPIYLNQIMKDIDTFYDFIRARQIKLPKDITLALDLTLEDDTIMTDYYFVDHDRRIVFFLDEFQSETLACWNHVQGVTSIDHIRHEMEAQYWYHCMLYPSTTTITERHIHDVRDILLHYIGDMTTSIFSTSPYTLDELYKMLGLVNSLKKTVSAPSPGAVNLLGRFMHVFARQKFYNWHGQSEARIYRDQSVYGPPNKHRTLLIRILSPLLFSAPEVHLVNLGKMWVDGIMHGAVWTQSIAKLNEEWQELILYATVLLNANVAFLAIQSIDIQQNPYRTPIQIASYLSIVSSIGSIILGLLLIRQNRTRAHGTATDVTNFLKARSHPTLGLETLAILYSLPYALLLWGMVSFLAAFAWNCFDDANISTRTIMGVAWVAFTALVVWCVWMGWVKKEDTDESTNIPGAPPEVVSNEKGATGSQNPPNAGDPDSQSVSNKSRRSHHSRLSNNSNTGQVAVSRRWNWNWPAIFLFNVRRKSYDSGRTIV